MVRHSQYWSAIAVVLLVSSTISARADQYWIAYEGNDFPENEGWTRGFSAGGANRYIEDGALVIDSLASTDVYDDYQWVGLTNPEAGETFVMQWRSLVEQQTTWFDASITLARSGPPGDLTVLLGPDTVLMLDQWTEFQITPGLWHEYHLQSADMENFSLSVDGDLAISGTFQTPSILSAFVSFGDSWVGSASLSRWDYFRFGVVPEPPSDLLIAVVAFCIWRKR